MRSMTLTSADNGKSIQVHQGDEIVVRLPENPTTGYRWQIDQVAGLIELEADSYQPESNMQFGSGGTREFRFRTKELGTARLGLKHWQAWEGEKSVTDRFAVEIQVAG
jgi:inhibitor of cysteine peptidase